jgi:hypothetical protein
MAYITYNYMYILCILHAYIFRKHVHPYTHTFTHIFPSVFLNTLKKKKRHEFILKIIW